MPSFSLLTPTKVRSRNFLSSLGSEHSVDGEDAIHLVHVAIEKGDVIQAMHHCHSGIELVDAALAASPKSSLAIAAPLHMTRRTLQSLLLELEAEGLQQEQRLLFLPDYLAGVGV